jgi:hypothetical protein
MTRVCRKMWRTDGKAGCVLRRKTKTGLTVGIYHAEQAGYGSIGPWLLVCETHDVAVERRGQRVCRDTVGKPHSWCPVCNGKNPVGLQFNQPRPKDVPVGAVTPPVGDLDTKPVPVPVEPIEALSCPIRASRDHRKVGVELLDCHHWSYWEQKGVCTACERNYPKVELHEERPAADPRCPYAYRIVGR